MLVVSDQLCSKLSWKYWKMPRKWKILIFKKCHVYNCLSSKKNRSTEGCSKLKSPGTRQVQERLVSTLEHMQVPKWDRTRCPEELAYSVGMPHPLQMFYGNLIQLGKKSNLVTRSRSVKGQKLVQCLINGGCHCIWSSSRMSWNIRERGTSYCLVRSQYRPQNFLRDDFNRSLTYHCPRSLLESRAARRIKHS